jgi:2-amino-4-hydroxy-6-hydroxymethyldihydropteridine diphosphokinase
MRAFIGLGGNVGDPLSSFVSAVGELRTVGEVSRASSVYASAPRDQLDQPEFRNAAVELLTELTPQQLLVELKSIERRLGRDPDGVRYGPRVIDLDILAIDGRCLVDEDLDLVVPHPRLPERRFALEPLAELDPDLRPWRGCDDLRIDVSVVDLLPSVAAQEVQRVTGQDWLDR